MSLTVYILGAFAIGVFAGLGWGYHAGYRSVIAPRKKPASQGEYIPLVPLQAPPVREKKS